MSPGTFEIDACLDGARRFHVEEETKMSSIRKIIVRVGGASIALLLGLTACQSSIAASPADASGRSSGESISTSKWRASQAIGPTAPAHPAANRGGNIRKRSNRSTHGRDFRKSPGGSQQKVTIVRGDYIDELACAFADVGQTSDPTTFTVDCRGVNSIFTGGFTGQTLSHLVYTMDVSGNIQGTYDEWFYGRYMGDGTQGELHFKGTFSGDGDTAEFFAEAQIVDGTCGFAGSTGTFTADGTTLFGGYTANWIRPKAPVPPDATCDPVDPASLPV
jgi:hypothetical protein